MPGWNRPKTTNFLRGDVSPDPPPGPPGGGGPKNKIKLRFNEVTEVPPQTRDALAGRHARERHNFDVAHQIATR